MAATLGESVFLYPNDRPAQHGYTDLVDLFRGKTVAIVGLGGTGSYVLDLVSKTEVEEIHLYDSEKFERANAFRAPGAFTPDQVAAESYKVEMYRERYTQFRRGIIAHSQDIGPDNVADLAQRSAVFLCIPSNPIKEMIFNTCPFVIDCGIGAKRDDEGGLRGALRVNTGHGSFTSALKSKVPLQPPTGADAYFNLQMAELNALNATLAVIKWKKHLEFYHDEKANQYHSGYIIRSNLLLNE